MIHQRLDDIDADTLTELCEANAPETNTLDYKQELYKPDKKAEFLKDVCALANAEGGDLVFGIAEAKGGAGKVMPITEPTADRAMRQMGQWLDGSVEPRIPGYQWKQVSAGDGYVLILRIAKSLIGPHRFLVNDMSRFPIRNGTHTPDMSYDQLRDAFGRTATLVEQAKAFRERRLKIVPDGLWKPLPENKPYLAIHLIPIESMTGRVGIDITAVHHRHLEFRGDDWEGTGCTYNLDGVLIKDLNSEPTITRYVQAFRNGALEAVDAEISTQEKGNLYIASKAFARSARTSIEKLLESSKKSGLDGAAVVSLTLGAVRNYEMFMSQYFNRVYGKYKSDRDTLHLPEMWIDSIANADVDDLAKPLLDLAWQSFGIESCRYFNPSGKWDPERMT